MLLSLHSFLSPPFPFKFPKSDRHLILSFLLKPFLSLGSLPHSPALLPPVAILLHILPSIVLVLPTFHPRGLCLRGPLTSAPGFLVAPSWSTHPWTPALSPDSGQGFHSAAPSSRATAHAAASQLDSSQLDPVTWPPLPASCRCQPCGASSPRALPVSLLSLNRHHDGAPRSAGSQGLCL